MPASLRLAVRKADRARPGLRGGAAALAIVVATIASPALAQGQPSPAPPGPTEALPEPQVPTAPAATGTTVAPATGGSKAAKETAKYKRFDDLMEPALTTNFPSSSDSILRDAGGVRSWLADRDIGIQGREATLFSYNPLDKGQPRSPQRYNGQRPTLQTNSLTFITTVGLNSVGLPNSRIILGMNYLVTTYAANGPNTISFRNLAWYQSFAQRKIELKFGIMPNYYEYVGFFTGGSPVLATGVAGLLPVQAGLSADPVHSPAANVTFHFPKGTYLKVGVQRSISPKGNPYEVMHNHTGLSWGMPGSGPLTIAEIGVQRPAKPGSKQIWLRAGGFYNKSDYTRFDGRGTENNQSAYAAGDIQITQPDQERPAHGIYVGASAFWNNPKVNTFTQSYEGRVYDIGVFKSRPKDTVALRAGYLKYSPDAYDANRAKGIFANKYQISTTASYSAHMGRGVYVTPAIAYIHAPSFIGDFKDAMVLSATVYLLI